MIPKYKISSEKARIIIHPHTQEMTPWSHCFNVTISMLQIILLGWIMCWCYSILSQLRVKEVCVLLTLIIHDCSVGILVGVTQRCLFLVTEYAEHVTLSLFLSSPLIQNTKLNDMGNEQSGVRVTGFCHCRFKEIEGLIYCWSEILLEHRRDLTSGDTIEENIFFICATLVGFRKQFLCSISLCQLKR